MAFCPVAVGLCLKFAGKPVDYYRMDQESWTAFRRALRADQDKQFYASKQDLDRFDQFVNRMPEPERIPTLLYAYERYRAPGPLCHDERGTVQFETSCYSILIGTILRSGIRPDRTEATEILRRSYHRCGHGSDIEPPLTLAQRAFRNQPYSNDLFDSVLEYRETLRSLRSSQAANVKCKLNWVLWHDSRRIEKRCHTRRIQQAIHAMDAEGAFRWEWLLRNTSAGLNAGPGKGWLKEGSKRLALVGAEQFYSKIDEWFTFPQEEVNLSAAGSAMLRLLVWYGALADTERSLPVLVRLAHVCWNKRAPISKVMAALAWLLRNHGGSKFAEEAGIICTNWASQSAEVRRLEQVYFPEQARARLQADQEARVQEKQDRLQIHSNALAEKYPRSFGPDNHAARYWASRRDAANFVH